MMIINNKLKMFIKPVYVVVLRILSKPKLIAEKKRNFRVQLLSNGGKPTFFGYHDKTPFSSTSDIILAMSYIGNDSTSNVKGKELELGFFRKGCSDKFDNNFIKFGSTKAWCWQQGCMLQWLPYGDDVHVIYNDVEDGGYVSKIKNIRTGELVRTYCAPVYSLDKVGEYAVTLNFSRLGRLRPGYGYEYFADHTINEFAPVDDGLFILNLKTNDLNLLISLYDLAKDVDPEFRYEHYVNHPSFSPDGNFLIFFHLWQKGKAVNRNLRVLRISLSDYSIKIIEDIDVISHYCWDNSCSILASTFSKEFGWQYHSYDVNNLTKTKIFSGPKRDGHPMFHPVNGNIVLADTYPDHRRDQHLYLIDLKENTMEQISSHYSNLKFSGDVRCDLHPRWDRSGTLISIDTVEKGNRNLGVINEI